jgi:hypothetical protein
LSNFGVIKWRPTPHATPGQQELKSDVLKKWDADSGLAIKPSATVEESVQLSEIRRHLSEMGAKRLDFIDKHATDPRIVAAVLGAPGLSTSDSRGFMVWVGWRSRKNGRRFSALFLCAFFFLRWRRLFATGEKPNY